MKESSSRKPNRLINETSPYLLQHAYNPVDWYPWGDEAFQKAKAEDKPVLVSIGYSACHWCHVMEHESFEDEAIATLMNERFVNIKVDMEERPDVDQIYMSFVQLTTGRGGWPMNVFLTPDKRPFFGGTYFPPTGRYNMPSWPQVLASIADAYQNNRGEIENSAGQIVEELRRMTVSAASADALTTDILDRAFESYRRSFDAANGGFGGAPKFPPAMSLEFLLRYHKRTKNELALEMVTRTCEKMACGGIYDQLGGGFHRYSVDAIWLVPHFEKMLYDNAQLARVYLHAYQVTGNALFRQIATETLDYVLREMTDASGGFYSSQDADSEGVEGKFFVWTPEEVADMLGKDAAMFDYYFDVTESGNFEEKNILNKKQSLADAARHLSVTDEELQTVIDRGRKLLFDAREHRTKPHRDEKVLTSWNGLMLAAFADAAGVLGDKRYLEAARRNADFLLNQLSNGGRFFRTWKNGEAKLNGYLEDYSNVADGLIELYQLCGEPAYLHEAKRLADLMITEFWDEENGGFFFTSNDHEELIVRNKDFYDNATPSGNSVAADVMLKLSKFYQDERYERFAVAVLKIVGPQISRYPQGFGRTLSALEFHLGSTKEIALLGDRPNDLEKYLFRTYLPTSIIAKSEEHPGEDEKIQLLRDRRTIDKKPTVFVCENFVCGLPITSVKELAETLGE